MEIIILDGSRMTARAQSYEYLRNTFRFPEYFGNNLDALNDCLGELGNNVIIIMVNSQAMKDNLGKYGEKMLKVFHEAENCTFIEK